MHLFSNQRRVIYSMFAKSLILCFKIFFIFLVYRMTRINIALALFWFFFFLIYLTCDLRCLVIVQGICHMSYRISLSEDYFVFK